MYSIQFMEEIEKENFSNSGQISPISMNFNGVAQKNFSYYNKDNIDLNRFFEKMTFQDLYNDFAEENTPQHSNSLQSSSSSNLPQQISQHSNTPTSQISQNSCQMPLQEFTNNYQNMNYRQKIQLQTQSSFCSSASTNSSQISSFGSAATYQSNPFSNITNIKGNNCTVITTQGNTPSHFSHQHAANQQLLQNIPFNKQTSFKVEKKQTKQLRLKNSLDEFFSRPLDCKFQQKIMYQNTCPYIIPMSVNSMQNFSDQFCGNNNSTKNNNNNTYDLFSNSTNSSSCFSLFMSQQNSQSFSESETNSEFSVY
ncbi:hypothetical protein ABPG74_003869 [Tetrahymena malaccensis]